MSTRCNVIIKDDYSKLYFYRHSDGYPDGVMPTLTKFLDWVKEGKIRDNPGQAAGWLIIIGAAEYEPYLNPPTWVKTKTGLKLKENKKKKPILLGEYTPDNKNVNDWKVGAYEPTDDIHGDIDYLYIIDLKSKTIETITKGFRKYGRKS